jgi:hypothetical protein
MFELIVQEFCDVNLKVTFFKDNIPAEKCYRQFFDHEYRDENGINFLLEPWNQTDEVISLIRFKSC